MINVHIFFQYYFIIFYKNIFFYDSDYMITKIEFYTFFENFIRWQILICLLVYFYFDFNFVLFWFQFPFQFEFNLSVNLFLFLLYFILGYIWVCLWFSKTSQPVRRMSTYSARRWSFIVFINIRLMTAGTYTIFYFCTE